MPYRYGTFTAPRGEEHEQSVRSAAPAPAEAPAGPLAALPRQGSPSGSPVAGSLGSTARHRRTASPSVSGLRLSATCPAKRTATPSPTSPPMGTPLPELPPGEVGVRLIVYDLLPEANVVLQGLGLPQVFHSGVAIASPDGAELVEYAYGGGAGHATGVWRQQPRALPKDFGDGRNKPVFRESLMMGVCDSEAVGEAVRALEPEYTRDSYCVVGRNCHHFAATLCRALVDRHIPEWVSGGRMGTAVAAVAVYAEVRAAGEPDGGARRIQAEDAVFRVLPRAVAEGVTKLTGHELEQGLTAMKQLLGSLCQDADSWRRLHATVKALPPAAIESAVVMSPAAEVFLRADTEWIVQLAHAVPLIAAAAERLYADPKRALSPEDAAAASAVWRIAAQIPRELRRRFVQSCGLPKRYTALCNELAWLSGDECSNIGDRVQQLPVISAAAHTLRTRWRRRTGKTPRPGAQQGQDAAADEAARSALRSVLEAVRGVPPDVIVSGAPVLGTTKGSGMLIAIAADVSQDLTDDDIARLVAAGDAASRDPLPMAAQDGCAGAWCGGLYALTGTGCCARKGIRPPPPEHHRAAGAVLKAQLRQLLRWFAAEAREASSDAVVFAAGVLLSTAALFGVVTELVLHLRLFHALLSLALCPCGLVLAALPAAGASYACRALAEWVLAHASALRTACGRGLACLLLACAVHTLGPQLWWEALLSFPGRAVAAGLLVAAGLCELCVLGNSSAALDLLYFDAKHSSHCAARAEQAADKVGELRPPQLQRMLNCGDRTASDVLARLSQSPGQDALYVQDFVRWWRQRRHCVRGAGQRADAERGISDSEEGPKEGSPRQGGGQRWAAKGASMATGVTAGLAAAWGVWVSSLYLVDGSWDLPSLVAAADPLGFALCCAALAAAALLPDAQEDCPGDAAPSPVQRLKLGVALLAHPRGRGGCLMALSLWGFAGWAVVRSGSQEAAPGAHWAVPPLAMLLCGLAGVLCGGLDGEPAPEKPCSEEGSSTQSSSSAPETPTTGARTFGDTYASVPPLGDTRGAPSEADASVRHRAANAPLDATTKSLRLPALAAVAAGQAARQLTPRRDTPRRNTPRSPAGGEAADEASPRALAAGTRLTATPRDPGADPPAEQSPRQEACVTTLPASPTQRAPR
eukprot:TRINITY_DN2696_c0_g1_i1.p1 TRINITY_DN2696_c0_g1~~TRINITY_DN2696_c0_g1_i1.p1  ORF type:complete len:1150 (+),score=297.92 TRINITY_DN2696_c0_g1_i1:79-3528(+)